MQEKCRSNLMLDGETVYSVVKCSHLLLLAKVLLIDLVEKLEQTLSSSSPSFGLLKWFSLRLAFLYQQCFEERSATLTKLSLEYIEQLDKKLDALNQSGYDKSMLKCVRVLFQLEIGHIYYQSYNWSSGEEAFKRALELTGIEYSLTGVYGKRTKFQQKDLAQLLLQVHRRRRSDDDGENSDGDGDETV